MSRVDVEYKLNENFASSPAVSPRGIRMNASSSFLNLKKVTSAQNLRHFGKVLSQKASSKGSFECVDFEEDEETTATMLEACPSSIRVKYSNKGDPGTRATPLPAHVHSTKFDEYLEFSQRKKRNSILNFTTSRKTQAVVKPSK
ncbi:hypothetical protein FVE85_2944 [Porphyridium purpureum]|uniref:Uncharacterized protein n=1 Tax=Porphyridium purpureum TaxID=35688 RepID=A0A5J4YVF0_PORPP|nr:hypothetical protein FVE85_2944 [Porphyridium purpureum]|eukprot:POR7443..scf227_4